jgi:hypothetical protein
VHVDEPGGHDAIARVDRARGGRAGKIADRDDAIAGNAEVRAQPRIARAIHDASVANQNIKSRRLGRLSRKSDGRKTQDRKDSAHQRIVVTWACLLHSLAPCLKFRKI